MLRQHFVISPEGHVIFFFSGFVLFSQQELLMGLDKGDKQLAKRGNIFQTLTDLESFIKNL